MSCSGMDELKLPDGSVAKVVALVFHFKRSRFYLSLLFCYNLSPEGHLFYFRLSTRSGCF